ncbi:MAG: cell division ATP-binding protein FtsE [Gemmatimonadaceae bacterium 4484_173]|nr:MAG: cell division ATP-binding protein FtsE [Gemmatimonadaceae bacterium 4484_173]RKZ04227.1 MAG: cell division ATP-binding protein FtsE [Candidatus Fermentibacteria bacterium]
MNLLVTMNSVRLSYGRWPALDNVEMEIRQGEFLVISGPSGAGKTTLLRLIWMGERPDSGFVEVSGFRSDRIRKRELPQLRRKIGIVFQDFRLLDSRTVFDNVALPLQVTGTGNRTVQKRVISLLARMGLSHRRNAFPHELSGGEQQRVAIARAMVAHPVILLADEPTGNLDPEVSREVVDLLLEINRGGTTVVMATHDPRQVPAGKGRFLFLDRGVLRRADRWTELDEES